jgi:type 1 glutamine amidotransferase
MKLLRTCLLAGLLASSLPSGNAAHPVPDSPQWLTYDGGEGPGKGKHVVLIAADQEYRSEQAMPMMAGILSKHHGFDCTVLFGVNPEGLVDPTMPVYPKKGEEDNFQEHNIPGLEHLETADLVIFFPRLLTLPREQLDLIVRYLDSGKPFLTLRTGNHGFRGPLPYEINGKEKLSFGHIVGGSFMGHHGNWHRDSTRGDIVEAMKDHPILKGVQDIWGPSDVYRTYKEGTGLPEDCTALVYGQPLIGREQGGQSNPKKIPLPVVWIKTWKTTTGQSARVLHSTMGSARDLENPGLRRLIINGVYWGVGLEDKISAERSVDYTAEYKPLESGFAYEKLGVVPQPAAAYR